MKHKASAPLEKFRISGSKIGNTGNDLTRTGGDCVE
jgi:hypothetical protein